jgi:hypothetical protein
MGQIARERGASLWATRQMIEYLRGWERGLRQRQRHNGHDNGSSDEDT